MFPNWLASVPAYPVAASHLSREVSTENRARMLEKGITGTIVGLGKVANPNETWLAKVAR